MSSPRSKRLKDRISKGFRPRERAVRIPAGIYPVLSAVQALRTAESRAAWPRKRPPRAWYAITACHPWPEETKNLTCPMSRRSRLAAKGEGKVQ